MTYYTKEQVKPLVCCRYADPLWNGLRQLKTIGNVKPDKRGRYDALAVEKYIATRDWLRGYRTYIAAAVHALETT